MKGIEKMGNRIYLIFETDGGDEDPIASVSKLEYVEKAIEYYLDQRCCEIGKVKTNPNNNQITVEVHEGDPEHYWYEDYVVVETVIDAFKESEVV